MIDSHKEELDKTKEDYNNTKKVVDELRASEVSSINLDSINILINLVKMVLFLTSAFLEAK
jgi:hypothetical protein